MEYRSMTPSHFKVKDRTQFDEEELKIKLITDDFDFIQTKLTNQLNEKTREIRKLRLEVDTLNQQVIDLKDELRVLLRFLKENEVQF